MQNPVLLFLTVALHVVISIFNAVYPYVFDKKYDKYYLPYMLLIYIHWIFFGECLLSYMEKKFVYGHSYKRGMDAQQHPSVDLIFGRYGKVIKKLLISMSISLGCIAVVVVLLRSTWINIYLRWIFILFAVSCNLFYIGKKFKWFK